MLLGDALKAARAAKNGQAPPPPTVSSIPVPSKSFSPSITTIAPPPQPVASAFTITPPPKVALPQDADKKVPMSIGEQMRLARLAKNGQVPPTTPPVVPSPPVLPSSPVLPPSPVAVAAKVLPPVSPAKPLVSKIEAPAGAPKKFAVPLPPTKPSMVPPQPPPVPVQVPLVVEESRETEVATAPAPHATISTEKPAPKKWGTAAITGTAVAKSVPPTPKSFLPSSSSTASKIVIVKKTVTPPPAVIEEPPAPVIEVAPTPPPPPAPVKSKFPIPPPKKEDKFAVYVRMQKAGVSDEAIKMKMAEEGTLTTAEIKGFFFFNKSVAVDSPPVHAPVPAPLPPVVEQVVPVAVESVLATPDLSLVDVAAAETTACPSSTQSPPAIVDKLVRYKEFQSMGVDDAAIRLIMEKDGCSQVEIDGLLSPYGTTNGVAHLVVGVVGSNSYKGLHRGDNSSNEASVTTDRLSSEQVAPLTNVLSVASLDTLSNFIEVKKHTDYAIQQDLREEGLTDDDLYEALHTSEKSSKQRPQYNDDGADEENVNVDYTSLDDVSDGNEQQRERDSLVSLDMIMSPHRRPSRLSVEMLCSYNEQSLEQVAAQENPFQKTSTNTTALKRKNTAEEGAAEWSAKPPTSRSSKTMNATPKSSVLSSKATKTKSKEELEAEINERLEKLGVMSDDDKLVFLDQEKYVAAYDAKSHEDKKMDHLLKLGQAFVRSDSLRLSRASSLRTSPQAARMSRNTSLRKSPDRVSEDTIGSTFNTATITTLETVTDMDIECSSKTDMSNDDTTTAVTISTTSTKDNSESYKDDTVVSVKESTTQSIDSLSLSSTLEDGSEVTTSFPAEASSTYTSAKSVSQISAKVDDNLQAESPSSTPRSLPSITETETCMSERPSSTTTTTSSLRPSTSEMEMRMSQPTDEVNTQAADSPLPSIDENISIDGNVPILSTTEKLSDGCDIEANNNSIITTEKEPPSSSSSSSSNKKQQLEQTELLQMQEQALRQQMIQSGHKAVDIDKMFKPKPVITIPIVPVPATAGKPSDGSVPTTARTPRNKSGYKPISPNYRSPEESDGWIRGNSGDSGAGVKKIEPQLEPASPSKRPVSNGGMGSLFKNLF